MELTASGGPSFFIRTDYLVSVAPEKLCCGAFFSDEETEDIVQAGFAFAAERQALSFLNRSEHSRFMLELKLAKKGHAKDASAKALDRLEKEKLLDDFRFAQAWLHNRLLKKAEGPSRLTAELSARGVNRIVCEKAVCDLLQTVSVEQLCSRAAEKQRRLGKSGKKLEDALLRSGFEYRHIRQALGL